MNTRWEYLQLDAPFTHAEEQANELGKDGWEMVNAESSQGYVLMWFKRPHIPDSTIIPRWEIKMSKHRDIPASPDEKEQPDA